jgi:hypothetical protein
MGAHRKLTPDELAAYADIAEAAERLEQAKAKANAEAARRREISGGVILSITEAAKMQDRKRGSR